jgi:hypothetical protein
MRTFVRHTLTRIGATALLVLLTTAAHMVAAPGIAQARCDGASAVKSQIIDPAYPTNILAEEWPEAGTCNSNNTYTGVYRSLQPGWDVYVYYQNNGVWARAGCAYGSTCRFSYPDDNYYSYLHLCIRNRSNPNSWMCGWGSEVYPQLTHRAYGINWGY